MLVPYLGGMDTFNDSTHNKLLVPYTKLYIYQNLSLVWNEQSNYMLGMSEPYEFKNGDRLPEFDTENDYTYIWYKDTNY